FAIQPLGCRLDVLAFRRLSSVCEHRLGRRPTCRFVFRCGDIHHHRSLTSDGLNYERQHERLFDLDCAEAVIDALDRGYGRASQDLRAAFIEMNGLVVVENFGPLGARERPIGRRYREAAWIIARLKHTASAAGHGDEVCVRSNPAGEWNSRLDLKGVGRLRLAWKPGVDTGTD